MEKECECCMQEFDESELTDNMCDECYNDECDCDKPVSPFKEMEDFVGEGKL